MNPYPGCSCGALTHFFPQNNGLPGGLSRSALGIYPHGNFCVGGLSRLQLFVYLQARRFARHPDCSHRCISSTQGGRGFYVPAYLGLLPRRAGDMLTVRFGQLTVEGLSPSKIYSLAGCSHTPSASGHHYSWPKKPFKHSWKTRIGRRRLPHKSNSFHVEAWFKVRGAHLTS